MHAVNLKENGSGQPEKTSDIQFGCLVKIDELPTNGLDKKIIKASISNYCNPKYVDYRKGHTTCIIRLEDPGVTKEFIEKFKGGDKLIIQNKKVELFQ